MKRRKEKVFYKGKGFADLVKLRTALWNRAFHHQEAQDDAPSS
jgi:hypothetical protein